MKNYKWARVKNIAPYVKTEDYSSDEESFALSRRLYSHEGKEYPILSLSIYGDLSFDNKTGKPNQPNGIRGVSSAFKSGSQEWWDEYSTYIPLELFDDVIEMLAEARAKIEKQ